MGKRNELINNSQKKKKGINSKNNKKNKNNKITPKKVIVIGIFFTVISLIIYGGISSLKTFNGNLLICQMKEMYILVNQQELPRY